MPEKRGAFRRAARWLLKLLAFVAVLGVVATGAFELWLRTDPGRDFLAGRLEKLLSNEVLGSLRIGRIDRYSLGTVVARDVDFLDPRGKAVIEIPEVELGIDLGALLSRTIRLEDARARDAVVTIAPGRHGKSTSIEETFAKQGPKEGEGPPKFDIDTGTIHFDRTHLVLAMGDPRMRLDGLEGFVRVSRRGDRKVEVTLDRVEGAWSLPDTRMLDGAHRFHASGQVDGNSDPLLDLKLRACFRRGAVPMRLRYGSRTGAKLAYDAEEARLVGLAIRAVDLVAGGAVEAQRASVDVSHLDQCS
ncbi:MAG: hypothetical protein H5U40_15870 [Polyangiaceae bacterium]|nr:hypothetical protein [Polyangiaceae bacterium]